jgi:DNA modification methylase
MEIESKKITLVDPNKVTLNPKNRNKHPEEQIDHLADVIRYQGFRNPIVISNLSGHVAAGEGRVLAARKLGMKHIPAIFQDFKNEEQEWAFGISDNALALQSDLDFSGINADLPEFGPEFDIRMLGIENFEIDVADREGLTDPDAVPPPPVDPVTKLGDLWILGKHRLLCGDSTNVQHVERLMDGSKADLVFTDPPYGVNYDGGHAQKGKRREKLANDESTEIYTGSVPMMAAFSSEKAALYLWFAATKSLQVLQVLQDNQYEIRSWLIWNKNMAQFGAIGAQYKQKHEPCLYAYKKGCAPFWYGPNNEVSVWDEKRSSVNEFHPTQKPVELSKRAINNSCPKNGIILDLFGGSGSTMIGAESTGRAARLMELEPKYCDVIVSRWAQFTGLDPVRDDGVTWSSLNSGKPAPKKPEKKPKKKKK